VTLQKLYVLLIANVRRVSKLYSMILFQFLGSFTESQKASHGSIMFVHVTLTTWISVKFDMGTLMKCVE
jgi:hypothetical protein